MVQKRLRAFLNHFFTNRELKANGSAAPVSYGNAVLREYRPDIFSGLNHDFSLTLREKYGKIFFVF